MPVENLFSIADVAKSLKLSNGTVRRMLHDGRLPGLKVGRQWRIADSTLQRIYRGELTLEIPR